MISDECIQGRVLLNDGVLEQFQIRRIVRGLFSITRENLLVVACQNYNVTMNDIDTMKQPLKGNIRPGRNRLHFQIRAYLVTIQLLYDTAYHIDSVNTCYD